MSDGVLTRALADLERAGIPLAATLDPARRDDCRRAPGIGRKALGRLQEAAVEAAALTRCRMTPTPDAIRAAREAAGLTQAVAAALVHVDARTWRRWEAGATRMHPAIWDAFVSASTFSATGRATVAADDR